MFWITINQSYIISFDYNYIKFYNKIGYDFDINIPII